MTYHVPVLLPQCIEGLRILPDGVYVDVTMGGGGHTRAILERLGDRGVLFGFDQDAAAAVNAPDDERFHFVHGNFRFLKNYLRYYGFRHVNGILADLGVSSYQFDTPERGFTFRSPAALDMRMNNSSRLTAAEVVNRYSRDDLERIFREYGEEHHAGRIADGIVERRKTKPFSRTTELAQAIKEYMPGHGRGEDQHPAKRCFQAIRIEVNHELDGLEMLLNDGIRRLKNGGRFAVISFHSLEDRIVKEAFKTAESPCTCPRDFPVCVCGKKSLGTVITKKPIEPTEEEIEINPRSRSSKLRVFERNDNEQYN